MTRNLAVFPFVLAAALACSLSAATVQFSVMFGYGDTEPAAWNGSIRASGARVEAIEVWRAEPADSVEDLSWKLATRKVILTRGQHDRERQPLLENGVYVTAEVGDTAAHFEVETAQGRFGFGSRDLQWGKPLSFLGGRARVERLPVTRRLTNSIEEQDFPALAKRDGKLYLAYVEFTYGDRQRDWPRQLKEKPASFDDLRRPAGGDRVWLRERTADGAWGEPEAVTPPGQDVYKTAVAVDGADRVWVFWSAQVDGNFDIYARHRSNGAWSRPLRLTRDPGPDLTPVAATDSEGAVWVAWQGARGNLETLVARQQGESFSGEHLVSFSEASDWCPQITTGPEGAVAVVWDTYHKGDYDVYARRLQWRDGIRMDEPVAVAASAKFEARPSAAFDPAGRLWIAYEESYPAWGKDFGAYETTGTGLFQRTGVRLKVLAGGRVFTTADSPEPLLERLPPTHPYNKRLGKNAGPYPDQPDPTRAANRKPGSTPYARYYPSTCFPRLAVSPEGTVFLAYRSAGGRVWGPLGTAWFENIAFYDGEQWQGPVFTARSDGLLDNRPAMVGLEGQRLVMVAATDHRFSKSGLRRRELAEALNHDLFAHELAPGAAPSKTDLTELAAERPAEPTGDVTPERRQVALMRDYRVKLGENTWQLLRGEFHRHTEISGDGGNDGPIIDAWRYLLDASSMDWAGCCDHDNGSGREYPWWITQKMTDAFLIPGVFTPMFSYERSVRYPEGHRNVIFVQRGIRTLPRLPKMADDSPPSPAPDTQMLYEYLRRFDGIAAVHTSGTRMGTDWRDNDPAVEPVVEIYQGDRQNYEIPGGPRANTAEDSIGGWRPKGFVSLALEKGYRLGFQASSDHMSTHMSYCNLWVTEPTREAILDAFKKRRVYGATDNILADVRSASHFMGEEFNVSKPPSLHVKLAGTADFAKVHVIKDGVYVYTIEPDKREVTFTWKDTNAIAGKTSYYYVRGEQSDGEIVWVSPMWITYR